MNLFVRVLLVSFLASFAGCIGTDAAISEFGDPVKDAGILGTWEVERCSPTCAKVGMQIRISRDGESEYFIEVLDSTKSKRCQLGLVELDGVIYSQPPIPFESSKEKNAKHSPQYLFPSRFERRGDWIAMSQIDFNALKQAVAESGHRIETDFWTTVDCSPSELAIFLREHNQEIYGEGMVCRRVSESQTPDSTSITK